MFHTDSPGILNGKWVYHYTTIETALEWILPSGNIKIGSIEKMNDLREAKEWHFSGRGGDIVNPINFLELSARGGELLRDDAKLFCTVQDDAVRGAFRHWHRGYCRPRMWAQYSNNHRGICLIFDKEKLNSAITDGVGKQCWIRSGPIRYIDDDHDSIHAFELDLDSVRQTSIEVEIEKMLQKHYKSYYFTKNSDWASEKEWRWVIKGAGVGDIFVPFRDSLAGIMLGPDTPDTYLPTIKKLAQKHSIQDYTARLIWFNRGFIFIPSSVLFHEFQP